MCGNALHSIVFARIEGCGLFCYVSRSLLPCFLLLWSFPVLAQKPEMRADPDVWLSTPRVQQARSILGSSDDLYSSLVEVGTSRLETIAGSKGEWVMRLGDLRLLVDSAGVNHSKSHNVGFNVGAVPFYWNNKVFLAGGAGFWHYHSKVLEFVSNTGEWEWSPCPSGPEHFRQQFAWWDGQNNRVVALGYEKTGTGAIETTGLFHALNMNGYSWELLGQYNPVFELIMKDDVGRPVDMGDYFLVSSVHNSLVVRKSDLTAVISSAFNRGPLVKHSKAPIDEGFKCFRRTAGEFWIEHHNPGDSVEIMLHWNVDSVFNALASASMPLVVPAAIETAEGPSQLESEGGGGPWKFLGALLALVVAFVLGRGVSRKRDAAANAVPASAQSGTAQVKVDVGLSPTVLKFHSLGPISMDTEEVNALLNLGDDLTGETKRARRAQAIRQVNQEYALRYGVDLIRRERHEADRRRTTYVIQPYSDNA